jgi:hypothetical protein
MITIKGIYGREMYDTWYAMSSMLGNSPVLRERIASVITHRFPAGVSSYGMAPPLAPGWLRPFVLQLRCALSGPSPERRHL